MAGKLEPITKNYHKNLPSLSSCENWKCFGRRSEFIFSSSLIGWLVLGLLCNWLSWWHTCNTHKCAQSTEVDSETKRKFSFQVLSYICLQYYLCACKIILSALNIFVCSLNIDCSPTNGAQIQHHIFFLLHFLGFDFF